jgi:hypothetical protein
MSAFTYYFKLEWDDAGVADTDVITAIEGAFADPEDVTITDSTDDVVEALAVNSFGADIKATLDAAETFIAAGNLNSAALTLQTLPGQAEALRRAIADKKAGSQ